MKLGKSISKVRKIFVLFWLSPLRLRLLTLVHLT